MPQPNVETETGYRTMFPDATLFMRVGRVGSKAKWVAVMGLESSATPTKLLLTLETFNAEFSRQEALAYAEAWREYAIEHKIWETRQ